MRVTRFRAATLIALLACGLLTACQPDPSPPAEPDAVAQEVAAPASSYCMLTVGWDPWEPYHYLAIGGGLQGLDVEIVRAVAEQADCELDFLQGGWDSLLRLLRAGELDLMLGATRTPAREEWARFSEPYRAETFKLFVLERRAEEFTGRGLADLLDDGFLLGVTQGYYYGPAVNPLIEQPRYDDQVVQAAVGELNFSWLLDMQIDGFIEDPFVAAAIERRRRDTEPIVALPGELGAGQVTFMFSRTGVDADTVERFNAGIRALRESGRYQALLDQYLE